MCFFRKRYHKRVPTCELRQFSERVIFSKIIIHWYQFVFQNVSRIQENKKKKLLFNNFVVKFSYISLLKFTVSPTINFSISCISLYIHQFYVLYTTISFLYIKVFHIILNVFRFSTILIIMVLFLYNIYYLFFEFF